MECTSDDEVVVLAFDGLKYRRSVCVVIMNDRGQFLGCRRCDNRRILQFVQGGAKLHETVQQTAEREVFEEIGLPARHLRFVAEILPTTVEREVRAAFRYRSKTWRKKGIIGQELYPLLYLAETGVIDLLHFKAVPGVRQEFCEAKWVTLEELMQKCPPSKAAAMANVCMAVASFARGGLGNGSDLTFCGGDAMQLVGAVQGTYVRNDGTAPGRGNTGDGGGHRNRQRRKPRVQPE
ncbi:NUDIX hydrolase, putative [Trypanosoma cruzi marinkellei]|uniref:NUDIX hydrolase, putative n=1 Tax=Trypanosoma cruzi marinkellei TaxID=85056 RepID=K2MRH3_TRYCR|nr:NUDIX hydrolase, putative [Trypanosoma cruzi marinkellei]